MARQEIRSRRATKRIETLYALVVKDAEGKEGVVRRNTPFGTMPWVTDDAVLAAAMRDTARLDIPKILRKSAYVVTFARVED